MKVSLDYIAGEVVSDNDVYRVEDNRFLKNLVLSKTILYPDHETRGHKHDGLDEVYFFTKGSGKMKIGEEVFEVKEGDLVLIEQGKLHKVFNHTLEDLEFVCVFQTYER